MIHDDDGLDVTGCLARTERFSSHLTFAKSSFLALAVSSFKLTHCKPCFADFPALQPLLLAPYELERRVLFDGPSDSFYWTKRRLLGCTSRLQ